MKYIFFLSFFFVIASCHINSDKLSSEILQKENIKFKNDTEKLKIDTLISEKGLVPVISVEPTIVRPNLYLSMKDEAHYEAEANHKLKQILSNLLFILKRNHLEIVGPSVSWERKESNSFIVEGGVPLEKKLTIDEPGTFYKETKRCAAAVAHFFGKRSLLPMAHDSLFSWVKENNKTPIGNPWVVYIDDNHVMKDPNFLQTDVYIEVK